MLPQSCLPRKSLLLSHNSRQQQGGIIPRGSLEAQHTVYWLWKRPLPGISLKLQGKIWGNSIFEIRTLYPDPNQTSPLNLVWVKLTQRDEAEQESEQQQEEEEETQQPLPPGAAGVGAAAESSSAKGAAVPVDLWEQGRAVSLTFKRWKWITEAWISKYN